MSYIVILTALIFLGLLGLYTRAGARRRHRQMPRLSSADSRRRRRESELRRQAQALQHRAATQLPHTHDAKPAQDAMPPDSLRGLVVLSRRDLSPHARQRLLYLTQHIARPRPLLAQIMRCPPGSRRLENLISRDPACATQLRDYLKAMEIELNAGSEGIVRQAVAQLGSDWVTDIVIRNLIHQSIQVPDPETAQAIASVADGCVVGSAIVAEIAKGQSPAEVAAYVKTLADGAHRA